MTVKELKALLADQPDERLVILSKDSEGNGFSPLAEVAEGMYVPYSTWSGEVYPTPEQILADSFLTEEDEAPEEATHVICLWSTN